MGYIFARPFAAAAGRGIWLKGALRARGDIGEEADAGSFVLKGSMAQTAQSSKDSAAAAAAAAAAGITRSKNCERRRRIENEFSVSRLER